MIYYHVEIVIFVLALALFSWFGKLPSVESITKFMQSLNTKGGNLFLLAGFTVLFSVISVRMFLYLIDLRVHKLLAPDDAYALQVVTWLTGGVSGGFIAALLKTMTGDTADTKPDVKP
jgi:hypothetical protein